MLNGVCQAGRQDMAVAVTVGGESVVWDVGGWNAPDRGDVFRVESSLSRLFAAVQCCSVAVSETRSGQTCKKVELLLAALGAARAMLPFAKQDPGQEAHPCFFNETSQHHV